MNGRKRRRGLTLIELIVLLAIVAIIIAMLAPAILSARKAARRAQCMNNMKQIGLAFHNFHDAFRKFPPSSGVTRDPEGKITAVDGWSFYAELLPFMEYGTIYDRLNIRKGHPDPGADDDSGEFEKEAARDARNTQLAELICPDNPNPKFADPVNKTGALTNYKAMGATHIESLQVASPKPTTPLYLPEEATRHPDGALFPGGRIKLSAFGRDGSAHTILCTETMDPQYGVWTVGAEVSLVGLPSAQPGPDGKPEALKFERYEDTYWAPAGYNAKFGDEAAPEVRRLKTYLGYDFAKADPGTYVGAEARNKYGPSSAHPGVVNHLLADGSVHSISTDTDFATYMFLITRAGGDPTGQFYDHR